MDAKEIVTRYNEVLERIARAAQRVGRNPADVCLVVVTKAQPLEKAIAVVEAGARDLGENYPEEGVEKMEALGRSDIRWHMIGHIQKRKARLVAERYDFVHSLDSVQLAERLESRAAEANRVLPGLLEFNVGGEESKFGWRAANESNWDSLLPDVEAVLQKPHLAVQGVMTVPPPVAEPEQARPYFQKLRRLRDFLARHFPRADWRHLSMGMSADYEVAVEEGATFVRVGTAILGARVYKT